MSRIVTRSFLLSLLLFAATAHPGTAVELERWLVPVAVRAAGGAYGSTWETAMTTMQEDFPLVIVSGYADEGGLPPLPVPFVPAPFNFRASAPDEPPGLILHVVKENAARLHVSATIRDISRPDTVAVSLPVLPAGSFASRPQYFIGVRRAPGQRITLRIYSLEVERGSGVATVRVIARDAQSRVIADVQSEVLLTAKQAYAGVLSNLPLRPLAAQLSIDALLGSATQGESALVISITPHDGIAAWSFLSVTSNDDQHTAIVLPQ